MSVRANFADICLQGMRDRSMQSGTELAREIQLTDWSTAGARQAGFYGFDQAITSAIYFTFHNGKKVVFRSSKLHINSSLSLKISVKKKRRKEIRFDKQNFFS